MVLTWSIQCVSGQPRSFFPTKKKEEEKKKKQRARKDGKSKKRIQGYSIYKDVVTKSGVKPMEELWAPCQQAGAISSTPIFCTNVPAASREGTRTLGELVLKGFAC